MKARLFGLAALASVAFAGASHAQAPAAMVTQTPDGTVIVAPAPGVPPRGVVDRVVPVDPPVTGSVGTTGPGCASTLTRQDEPDGSTTTVRQERCMR